MQRQNHAEKPHSAHVLQEVHEVLQGVIILHGPIPVLLQTPRFIEDPLHCIPGADDEFVLLHSQALADEALKLGLDQEAKEAADESLVVLCGHAAPHGLRRDV